LLLRRQRNEQAVDMDRFGFYLISCLNLLLVTVQFGIQQGQAMRALSMLMFPLVGLANAQLIRRRRPVYVANRELLFTLWAFLCHRTTMLGGECEGWA